MHRQRAEKFQYQFTAPATYGIPNGYFVPTGKDHTSQFDRDCSKIVDGFSMKFKGHSKEFNSHLSYLDEFSIEKWSELSLLEKSQHTMSECIRCFTIHKIPQQQFPLNPQYNPHPSVTINRAHFQQQGVKAFTTSLVSDLNQEYVSEANCSFTDALLQDRSFRLERKKTSGERRREKRQVHREVTKKVAQHFSENAAITMLIEGESRRMYHRKRMAQSFHTPEAPPPAKKHKSHSPDFTRVSWDTALRNWPADVTINWTAVARDQVGMQVK